jgi:hypothetical protein
MIWRPLQLGIEVKFRSIWNLIKQASHQVLIDLNPTSDEGVMTFPIKNYRDVDKMNVVLWWSCTLRWVLSIVHPCTVSYRGHVRSLFKVHSILKLFSKHNERYQQILTLSLCKHSNELTLCLTFMRISIGVMSSSTRYIHKTYYMSDLPLEYIYYTQVPISILHFPKVKE